MQCKVMSEIRWIRAEIKWAQIESAISRGRHTGTSLFTSRAAVHLPRWICVKMKEILIDSCGYPPHGFSLNTSRGKEMHLCICVCTAFLLQACDARVTVPAPACSYIPSAHLAPAFWTLQTSYWLITEVKKLWIYMTGERKSPAEAAGLN